jgi:hypothetical protein
MLFEVVGDAVVVGVGGGGGEGVGEIYEDFIGI